MITDDQIKALDYPYFINKGDHFYGVLEMIHGNGRLVTADINGIEKSELTSCNFNCEKIHQPWFTVLRPYPRR